MTRLITLLLKLVGTLDIGTLAKSSQPVEDKGDRTPNRQVSSVTVDRPDSWPLPHIFFSFFRFLFSLRVSCGALWVFRPCLFFPLLMRFPQIGFWSSELLIDKDILTLNSFFEQMSTLAKT